MKIYLILLTLIATAGCNAMLVSARSSPSENYASLSLVTRQQPQNPTWPYGLRAVSGQSLDPTQRLHVYVAEGRRTVWYACPDTISTDDGPSLTHDFIAGHEYELVCAPGATEGTIRQVESVGG